MKIRLFPLFIIAGLILTVLWACSRDAIYEQSQATNSEIWNKDVMLVFDGLEISDTADLYDFSLIVRHTRSYPFSNLYLFMQTTFPDQKMVTDTIEITLAKPDGQWLGKGFGNIREYKVDLNGSLKFPLGEHINLSSVRGCVLIILKESRIFLFRQGKPHRFVNH